MEGKVEQYFNSFLAKMPFLIIFLLVSLENNEPKSEEKHCYHLPIQKIITPTFEKTGLTFENPVHH